LIHETGVINSRIESRVKRMLGNSRHQPIVQKHRDWYYYEEEIMIKLKQGNILEADVEALINTVNCVGVMGKGVE